MQRPWPRPRPARPRGPPPVAAAASPRSTPAPAPAAAWRLWHAHEAVAVALEVLEGNPPQAAALCRTLRERGKDVYLLAAEARATGERDFPATVAAAATAGIDAAQVLSRDSAVELAAIRDAHPFGIVALIAGEEATAAAAAAVPGAADVVIGLAPAGDAAELQAWRTPVDLAVEGLAMLQDSILRTRIAFIGSGAWACAAAHVVASNVLEKPAVFEEEISMWMFPEDVPSDKGETVSLVDVFNQRQENVKYFPGKILEANIVATPDLKTCVEGADLLVFCMPHEHMYACVKSLKLLDCVDPGAHAISLTKGIRLTPKGPQLISQLITRSLGIQCSVLMGANIAADVYEDKFSEGTIGCKDIEGRGGLLQAAFGRRTFRVRVIADVEGAEMAGTLKNVVALAAGIVDGLEMGPNTKAAVMRIGLVEMVDVAQRLFPSARPATFFGESCGVADLIATCVAGRNRRAGEALARAGGGKTFAEIEEELAVGSLQGPRTALEVLEVLEARGWDADFPLLAAVGRVVRQELAPAELVAVLEDGRGDGGTRRGSAYY